MSHVGSLDPAHVDKPDVPKLLREALQRGLLVSQGLCRLRITHIALVLIVNVVFLHVFICKYIYFILSG